MEAGQVHTKEQKWNDLIATLIQEAGLPSTCLVRLTFMDAKQQRYTIMDSDALNKLAILFGEKTDESITMNVIIEILALNIEEYLKRFKYEHNKFNQEKRDNNSSIIKFELCALSSTKATIRQKIKQKIVVNSSDEKSVDEPVVKPQASKRDEFVIGSKCQIYSSSQKQWFDAVITNILNDDEGEWLKVQYTAYDIRKNKQVQRYNSHIRPIGEHNVMAIDPENSKRAVVYGYLDKIIDELDALGYDNVNDILSAIKVLVTSDSVLGEIRKKKGNAKMKQIRKKMSRRAPKDDLKDIMKKFEGWKCTKCTLINFKTFMICTACNSAKPK
eukprot:146059_1